MEQSGRRSPIKTNTVHEAIWAKVAIQDNHIWRIKQELWAKVATYMVKQRIIGRGSPRLQTSIRTSQSRRSSPQDQARTMGEGRHINAYANVFFLTQMHVHPAMCSPGSTPRCSPHIAGSTTIAYGCSVLHFGCDIFWYVRCEKHGRYRNCGERCWSC